MLNNSLIVLILELLLIHKDNCLLKLVLPKVAQSYVHIYLIYKTNKETNIDGIYFHKHRLKDVCFLER